MANLISKKFSKKIGQILKTARRERVNKVHYSTKKYFYPFFCIECWKILFFANIIHFYPITDYLGLGINTLTPKYEKTRSN